MGLIIGVLPGAGASIAAFVAYQQAKLFSKEPERFGKGHPDGIIAPEAANNGVTTGTLVPLLAIGIPGGSTAAIMMVVLQYHGVPFGPRLFVENPEIAYGVIASMLLAYVARGSVFDMWLAIVFGVIGFIARKTGYNVAAILIGVILGPMLERSYLLAMRLSGGDPMHLFSSTLGNVLWTLLVLTLL